MPKKLEIERYRADLAAISDLYKQAQNHNDPFGIFQFAKRKEIITTKLEALTHCEEKYASVALFFGGDPVLGSSGISADFSGKILDQFQEIVSGAYATIEGKLNLAERGKIPLKQSSRLHVTGVTRGSFGFILDELPKADQFTETSLKSITEEVTKILERTASPNDFDFEEVVEKLDDRLLGSLKEFFGTLKNSKATMRVVEDIADFTLDHTSIVRASDRISSITANDNNISIRGKFMGLLPVTKKFEFLVDNMPLITGSVSNEAVSQYNQMVETGNPLVTGQEWEIYVHKRTIKQLNRPEKDVYRLLEFTKKIAGENLIESNDTPIDSTQ